jgi:tRNA threonylcarbamoyladenosine biosynthesis protein TsaE
MFVYDYSLTEIAQAAKTVCAYCQNQAIWLFDGQMAAGKTTLIRAICKELGVEDDVQSPTFSIVNEYVTNNKDTIFHFDCYRLKSETEAFEIGIEDYLYSGNRCLIEWPEKIANLLPSNAVTIKIELISETERKIIINR